MVEQTDPNNPIGFIELPTTKDGIQREALKALGAESAILKAASAVRQAGNATVSLEPEMKALAGGLTFIAKDVGNLVADFLTLVAKAVELGRQTASPVPPTDPSGS
jgi:hypothetical protein